MRGLFAPAFRERAAAGRRLAAQFAAYGRRPGVLVLALHRDGSTARY